MKITDVDLSSLSREEYISLIACIIESFKLDYGHFTDKERQRIYYYMKSIICRKLNI